MSTDKTEQALPPLSEEIEHAICATSPGLLALAKRYEANTVHSYQFAREAEAIVRRAVRAALTATPPAQQQSEPTMDRESTWWALAMGAAASLEDAALCMRDADAKRAATGAAAHVRKQCAALTDATPPSLQEPQEAGHNVGIEPPERSARMTG